MSALFGFIRVESPAAWFRASPAWVQAIYGLGFWLALLHA